MGMLKSNKPQRWDLNSPKDGQVADGNVGDRHWLGYIVCADSEG